MSNVSLTNTTQSSYFAKLGEGFSILAKYATTPSLSCAFSAEKTQVQEAGFSNVNREDAIQLEKLGWSKVEPTIWSFQV